MRHIFLLLFICFCPYVRANQTSVTERVQVVETRASYFTTLRNLSPLQQALDDTSFSADSLATLLQQAPAVTLNGQGGLFQTINIRGFSRWRIQTRIEGIPIHTDRRAGTAMEFLPPSFVAQAQVVTGAASTQWGSGALGGGVDVELQIPEHLLFSLASGSQQDYRDLLVGGSNNSGELSWLINHRHANNSADANGNPLLDGFEHHSLALRKRNHDGLLRDALVLFSRANNIQKASADDPASRLTEYPLNQHWLGKLHFDWYNATLYAHKATTQTRVERPEVRVNLLQNDALSTGFQLNDQWQFDTWQLHWRIGMDARLDVTASEREITAINDQVFDQLNLSADQWESFISTEITRPLDRGVLVAGGRLTHMAQRDKLSGHSQNESNTSGFVGYRFDMHPKWQLATYISNAYRIPSLTERYFVGTTPRGRVEGSSDLIPEKAVNIDTRLHFKSATSDVVMSLFHQSLQNYIERIVITENLRRYQNLDRVNIRGINYSAEHRFNAFDTEWRGHLGGQWVEGKRPNGEGVADIPPPQHRLSLSARHSDHQWFVAITHRQRSDELVADEQPTESVNIMDAGYHYHLNSQMRFGINLTNITNQHFVTSRDSLAPFARGRDIHINFEFVPLGV